MFEDLISYVFDNVHDMLDEVGDNLQDAYDTVSEKLEQAIVALGKDVSDDDQYSIIREIFDRADIDLSDAKENVKIIAHATDADAYSDTAKHVMNKGGVISFGSGDCWDECKSSPVKDPFKRMTCGYYG